ncbi:MAG: ABC transporter substrate-binding protein [Chloroflexi bacterium]|nr:ABC transporter substrate-binding protein [Chloroflexota bacterium]
MTPRLLRRRYPFWSAGLTITLLVAVACGGAIPAPPAANAPPPASKAPEPAKPAASAPEPAKPAAPAAAQPAAPAAAQPAKPAGSVTEFRVGEALSLTGSFSAFGQLLQWSAQTAEDVVNNDYPDLKVPGGPGKGLEGLGGAPLKFIFRDDQSKGDLSRTAIEQLITVDKIHWYNGSASSGIMAQLQPVAEQAGIPSTGHVNSSPSLTEKGLKWFWRTGPNDALMVGNVFEFLKEWPQNGGPAEIKTLALLSCDNLFCADGRKVALEQAPKIGLQIAVDLTTKVGTQTLASEVQRLQAANADVLLLSQYPPDTIVFQSDSKRLGYNPKVVLTNNGAYSDETWLQAQKKTNGAVGWMGRDPTAFEIATKNERWQKINEIYKKYSNGQNMGEFAMREITGLLWMVDTINRAKSAEPAALQKAANDTNVGPDWLIIDYKGIRFQNGQNTLATGVITQIGWDGEKHTVWPWAAAKATGYQLINPNPTSQERDSRPKPGS